MPRVQRFALSPGWRLVLTDLGLSPATVFRAAGLPDDLPSRRDSRLTPRQYFGLWHALERIVGDPALPVRLVERFTAEAFDPSLFAAFCSPDFSVATRRIARFKPLFGPLRLEAGFTEGGFRMVLGAVGLEEPLPEVMVLTELALWTRIARMGTRHRVEPLAVRCPFDPPSEPALRDWFGCEPRRATGVELVLSAEDARRPFLTSDDALWAFFEPELQRRLGALRHVGEPADRVRAALLELLPSGRSGVDDVCEHLALSRRTLQRRLCEAGTSFQALRAEVRERLARHYLTGSDLSSTEIAYLLGFEDPNSFFRAFHSWTGTTPETVRGAARRETAMA